MSDKLDLILQQLEQLTRGQTEANERLSRVEDRQIRTDDTLAGGLKKADERLSRLEDGQTKANERLLRLEEGQAKANERLVRLEDGQKLLQADVSSIKEDVKHTLTEIRSHFKRVEDITDRQQRIIEILAARSVQHEADIEGIKRTISHQ